MESKLNPLVIIIPPQYVSALLKLHEKFEGKNIEWVLSGELGEALKAVRVEPDCIEIVTSKDGAQQIHESVDEFSPEQIAYRVQQLPRNALVGGIEYPLYIRSHYFEFQIDEIKVKVHGDLQYQVSDWGWGEKFECQPDSVYVVNRITFVVPLSVKNNLYQSLGWADRAEKVSWGNVYCRRLLNRTFR